MSVKNRRERFLMKSKKIVLDQDIDDDFFYEEPRDANSELCLEFTSFGNCTKLDTPNLQAPSIKECRSLNELEEEEPKLSFKKRLKHETSMLTSQNQTLCMRNRSALKLSIPYNLTIEKSSDENNC
jgi:hypothetical protein